MKRSYEIFLLFVVPVVCLLGLASASFSQAPQVWTNLGLYGGQIYDIAIDPSNPDKMFAGSYFGDGLYVTTDGASSWQAVVAAELVEGEDTFKNHAVWAAKIAPGNNNVIWAAHNYWVEKSTDGGKTWAHILNGWMQSSNYGTCSNCPKWDQWRWCLSLTVDPTDLKGNTVFVGTSGRYTNWTPYGAIYMTEDGGDTWRKLKGPVQDEPGEYTDPDDPGNFDYEVVALDIDASRPDVIVIWAVTSNQGVFIEEAREGDKISDGTLYRGEINRLTGAETWTEVFSMEGGEFYDVEVKPNDPNSIFTANDWGIFKHYFEEGEWKYQWILNLKEEPPPPGAVFARNVRALAFDPKNPDILYAAWKNVISQWENVDTSSKVARGTAPYEDFNWEIYTVEYQFLTLTVHPENSEFIFGGELARGVFKSQNHGLNWTPFNNGINAVLVDDVDVDPHDATHLLAATHSGVYERRGTGDWINTSDFEYTHVFSVEFDPTDPDGSTYYAGTERWLAKTTNSGAEWTLSDDLPNDFVNDIAIGPEGKTIFITTRKAGGSSGTTGVYRNENGLVTPALTQVLSSDAFDFNVVVIDPNDPNHVFAGGGGYFGTKVLGNLYESKTNGDSGTWQLTGLTDVIVNALLIDPRDSNVIYAGCGYSGGTDVPVYKSFDRGATWTPSFQGIPGLIDPLRGIWGISAKNVFVVGLVKVDASASSIWHYDGNGWTKMDSGTAEGLYGVWGSPSDSVFAVGNNGTVLHYDGSSWTEMNSDTEERLYDVWGTSGTDVFAVGRSGIIVHYDGNSWSAMTSGTTETLEGVWGSASDNVFAAGNNGTILHYDGSSWTGVDSGTTEDLWGVWGSSATDVFVVGTAGTILHYDGSTWSAMTSGVTKNLEYIWGSSGTDVFAVGAKGTILHYDGSSWIGMDSGTTRYMYSVWGSASDDVFAVSSYGTILHYNGSEWAISKLGGANWNSVTDMEFDRQNEDIVYAGTAAQGVYVSPNRAAIWANLGKPDFNVRAISTSSLYAATQGGLWQCTGTGVIAGKVTDAQSRTGIDYATIFTDFGVKTTCINGEYMMVSPAGIFNVTAIADDHANMTMLNVRVLGGDVSWAHMAMQRGVADAAAAPDGGGGGGDGGGSSGYG